MTVPARIAGLWQAPLSIRGVFLLAIAGYFVISVSGVLVHGWNPIFDWHSLLSIFAICIILAISLAMSDDVSFIIVSSISLYFIVMMLPKMAAYAWFPYKINVFHLSVLHDGIYVKWYMMDPALSSVNRGMLFILSGLLCFLSGVFLIGKACAPFIAKRSYRMNGIEFNGWSILISFMVFAVVDIYISVWLGDSVYSNVLYGADHRIVGIISHLISYKSIMMIGIIYYAGRKDLNGRSLYFIFFMLLLYVIATAFGGSRAASYDLVVYFVAAMIVIRGNFKAHIVDYLRFIVVVLLLAAISWPMGSYIRDNAINNRDAHHVVHRAVQHAGSSSDIVKGIEHGKLGVDTNIFRVLKRLCDFDYAMMTVTKHGNEYLKKKYINMTYAIKSAINIIVPGTVFANANINTSFLWPVIYGKVSPDILKNRSYYQTVTWTMWGLSYAMFGWWGGLLFMFACGVFFAFMNLLCRSICIRYRYIVLFMFFLYVFRFAGAMSIDDYIASGFFGLVYMAVALLFIYSLDMFYRKIGPHMRADAR